MHFVCHTFVLFIVVLVVSMEAVISVHVNVESVVVIVVVEDINSLVSGVVYELREGGTVGSAGLCQQSSRGMTSRFYSFLLELYLSLYLLICVCVWQLVKLISCESTMFFFMYEL